jgi:hypothetical protein
MPVKAITRMKSALRTLPYAGHHARALAAPAAGRGKQVASDDGTLGTSEWAFSAWDPSSGARLRSCAPGRDPPSNTSVTRLRQAIEDALSRHAGLRQLDEAVTGAIQELDHAPSRAEADRSLQLIFSENGDRAVKPDEKEFLTREYAELRNDLASSLDAHSQGRMSDDDFVHSIEGVYGAMGMMLESVEENLEGFEQFLGIAEERWKDKRPLYSEEEETGFLKRYLGPPLDGRDVYVRYETSVERRLQKDIETLYALQAIRRGSGRKLLGAGAIQS